MSVNHALLPIGKVIAWSLLGVVAVFTFLIGTVATGSQRYLPRTSDAIVVLGAAVWPGGRPSPALRGRAEKAAELYRTGYASHIITSGGKTGSLPAEASVAASILESLGIPRSAIIEEPMATSTEESARFVGELLKQRGWRDVIVVSDGYHLTRSVWLFRREGFRASAAAADDWYYSTGGRIYHILRETAAVSYLAAREAGAVVSGSLTNLLKEP